MEPVASSTVDSGARWFCGRTMYFRQIDQLTINVSTARNIEDDEWLTFLEDTLAISRHLHVVTRVSLIYCVYAYPNARQRMAVSKFLARHGLEKMERIAVVTDNTMVRGAMTAFGWIMPKLRMSAFHSADVADALQWLHEVGSFDEQQALLAWNDARTKLEMPLGVAMRPNPPIR